MLAVVKNEKDFPPADAVDESVDGLLCRGGTATDRPCDLAKGGVWPSRLGQVDEHFTVGEMRGRVGGRHDRQMSLADTRRTGQGHQAARIVGDRLTDEVEFFGPAYQLSGGNRNGRGRSHVGILAPMNRATPWPATVASSPRRT